MGVASEKRYVAFAARKAAGKLPSASEQFIRDLNAIPKNPEAVAPFGDINFVPSRGGWVAECPVTGYGFWYKTLRKAVSAWRVAVFADGLKLVGQPAP